MNENTLLNPELCASWAVKGWQDDHCKTVPFRLNFIWCSLFFKSWESPRRASCEPRMSRVRREISCWKMDL